MYELETVGAFDTWVSERGSLTGTACQGLDLRGRTTALCQSQVQGAFFLGCEVEQSALEYLNASGAYVFPSLGWLPFRPFRPSLYTTGELYDGYIPGDPATYEITPDAQSYYFHKRTQADDNVVGTLAERIHDHAIDDALRQLLRHVGEHRVVAIMGGHSLTRDDPTYAAVARLARSLTQQGFYVATGGGPGAMEAANLGGWMAGHHNEALDRALAILRIAPTFEPVGEWLDAGFTVREKWPNTARTPTSLGIPTWHYGHEPPNVFAGEVAKYFANSIREEGLLAIALAGVVYAPGSAGTIQEIFQDAAQNHYKSFGIASPMVFLNTAYWTETKPVYPLVEQLAAGHDYADGLALFDDVNDIVNFLVDKRSAAEQLAAENGDAAGGDSVATVES